MSALAFLDRQRTIARPGFSRWLVPPAALSIHLAIGQAYAFSVFNTPLTQIIGVKQSVKGQDWDPTTVGWIFSIAIVFLGLSAAVFGKWLENAGPRKAMFASACCFGGGFLVSALGVYWHQIVLIYLGYGVLGGIGLGLGYISPVSTLIKWFPDRPGMATGMAIMGFGGGALIGGPLGEMLMAHFQKASVTPTAGVMETFLVMGIGYFVFMLFGAATVRLPPPGWKPAGYTVPSRPQRLVTLANVTADQAITTRQFYLLWGVLFLNVTAGIGILGQASPMIQDMFSSVDKAAAAGFVGLLSLFNMGGRFFWSSLSDYIGRKGVYAVYFLLGACLYALIPMTGNMGSTILFVACCAVILTMYGGGFATIPAYLRDLFGTMQVGAIHGRLLTAWSAAGIAGPQLVSYIKKYQLDHNVATAHAYDFTMYLMAGLLLIGAVCNFLVTAVDPRHHFSGVAEHKPGGDGSAGLAVSPSELQNRPRV
ncbi:MAG TPA: OFA family MFS transporter [Pirellulales bacterium]|jgi:MFS family permease|nr:OFA family MFS transporter [Pirellulales bacterium]